MLFKVKRENEETLAETIKEIQEAKEHLQTLFDKP
jgi:hypothetical protein